MQVRELMNPAVVTVEPSSSAALAARLNSRHNVGALRCVAAEEDPAQVPVRDIMTRNCATVSPGDDCREATRLMAAQQVRRLPVTEGGKIVGIVSLGDLAKCQAFDMEAAKALSEISENIIRP